MKITNYFSTWWTIMLRPIYFYVKLKGESWKEASLTFLIITAWLLALIAGLVIFIIQYIPIGATLVEGMTGSKFILILPILLTLAFVFFLITFLILGGMFTAALFVMFYLAGQVLHYTFLLLGGRGDLSSKLQRVFYSCAPMLLAGLVFLLMILTKYLNLGFDLFRAGFNFIYCLIVLYIYGLWAVSGRRNYGVPKWKAFVGAAVPVVVLLIFGFVFDKIALSKLEPWIK